MQHAQALLTDLYQLTMAHSYWVHDRHEDEAIFHLFFRKHPFNGGYTIAAGLELVVEYLQHYRFEEDDILFLKTLTGNDNKPLFEANFLQYLREMAFACDIDAIPEGTIVFPHEPLLRVRGPLIQCQLLETVLLNIINFQTLIATKAARICHAAQGEPVLEFGLRRAQGIDGGLSASRAAYLGGCTATSNVLAGKQYGIPVKGTHAHSWVMSFDDEITAFTKYAEAMPNNCVFLVDTYDTLNGVRQAITVGQQLRARGHEMVGIRLDSGDLAWLSIEARRLLDEGGFPDAVIVASNDLDERIIGSLKQQGAQINVWGVGTKLVTAYDQPALGGVYKLAAIRQPEGQWRYTVKLSEQTIKVSNPGMLNVRRFEKDGIFAYDMLYNELEPMGNDCQIIDPLNPHRHRAVDEGTQHTDLLQPIYRAGRRVGAIDDLHQARARCQQQLTKFYCGCLRLENPHNYPVGLEATLFKLKEHLIEQAGT